MKHINPLPDVDYLRSILGYDPLTGIVTWLVDAASSVRAGSEAGTLHSDGYFRVMIGRKTYALHRVIWKIYHGVDPVGVVDHRDGVGSDNRIVQLRDASQRNNQWNRTVNRRSKTGVKGVVFNSRRQVYEINIKDAEGKRAPSGTFRTVEDALARLDELRVELHGEFACRGERPPSRPSEVKRPGRPKRASCTICGTRAHGHGLCFKHYQRWRIHGDPLFVNGAREEAA